MRLHVIADGTRPLLMHNVQLASPGNHFARQMKEISSKRTKTDEDREELARLEFTGSLYFDGDYGPYIGATMLFANLIEGAKISKNGKKVERGVEIAELRNPLLYDGPRTIEGLWADPRFRDTRSVRVNAARVDRTRPIFSEWRLEYDLIVDPDVLNYDEVVNAIKSAGSMSGLGDFRKLYGRYTAKVEQVDM